MRERVQAMKTIWTNDVATFHGDFVNFDEIWQWPKPTQKPHPRVIIGGDGQLALQHLVEYGDGWIPHPNRGDSPLADRLENANNKLAEAGRGRCQSRCSASGLTRPRSRCTRSLA